MASGIGLDVIDYAGGKRALFAFKWYNPTTKTQELKCHKDIWNLYFKKIRCMYVPFKYEGVYQIVHYVEFKI